MDNLRAGLARALETIVEYREGLQESTVAPAASRASIRQALGELPDGPTRLDQVIDELISAASPGLMASAGPRYYGFVIGGSLDAALVADVIASGWDQCAYNEALSPAAIAFEDVAGSWIKELLGLPATASVGFATGGQGANTIGLAAGRWQVLHQRGWDVGRDGLHSAPQIRVVVCAERHATIDRSVRLLGLGENAIVEVPPLPSGAMDTNALRDVLGDDDTTPTIVGAAAGNVNTGASDDMTALVKAAHAVGAWVHVDGAFGLWAAASPRTAHLVRGIELADSWACDGHKWLNVPYDAGYGGIPDGPSTRARVWWWRLCP
jgi:glutamate/tyrosine decarboxylase-like PLP-dependent enzyme